MNYTYDAGGNVTNDGSHTYQYDAENRLVNVDGGGTAQYFYDHHNRRYKKVAGSSTTVYVWEGSQVVSEHDGAGALLTEYIYASKRTIAKASGGATQYLVSDRLSNRLILDATGNVLGREAHLPFGDDFAESGAQDKHHFTSYERDAESGLDNAINRYERFAGGTFDSVDKDNGRTDIPQSLNRYSYGRNDPINAVDPLGLFIFNCEGRRLFPSAVTFLLDGLEVPEIVCYGLIAIIIVPIFQRNPPPRLPRIWTGFSSGDHVTINQAVDEALKLLKDSNCKQGLDANGLNSELVGKILSRILTKPDFFDSGGRIRDPWRIFNGDTTEDPDVSSFKSRPGIPAVVIPRAGGLTDGDIYIFPLFFNAQGGAHVNILLSRAVVLIHEAVHLTGKRDKDFSDTKDQVEGSRNLTDKIIHSCISPLYSFKDLAFPDVQ